MKTKLKYQKRNFLKISLLLLPISTITLSACAQEQNFKILSNYNGQADLLLSLQIPPDYYPYQYQENSYRSYLSKPSEYIKVNQHTSATKRTLNQKIDQRFQKLLSQVRANGPSLWNNAIYDSGTVSRNQSFWTNKYAALLFMERFVLDDYQTIAEARKILPNSETIIETNFRASRDPFTTFGTKVYQAAENLNTQNRSAPISDEQKIATGLENYKNQFPSQDPPDALYRYQSYINFWNQHIEKNKTTLNQYGFNQWIKNWSDHTNNKKTPIFYLGNEAIDQKLAELYSKVILSNAETKTINNFINPNQNNWKINYLDSTATVSSEPKKHNKKVKVLDHHPAFEQQANPGSSPAAEGSQRDTMVYLYQLAAGIDQYTKTKKALFDKNFKDDPRYLFMQHALSNVSLIAQNMQNRFKAIKAYLKAINVVDQNYDPENDNFIKDNSKVLSIVTYPPAFNGNATIQTISKFAFIYYDIGLKQPLPVQHNQTESTKNQTNPDLSWVKYAGETTQNLSNDNPEKGSEIFNIDDNGWWWNLGDGKKSTENLQNFNKTSDTVIITATDQDWSTLTGNATSGSNPYVKSLASISKTYQNNDPINKINSDQYSVHHVGYGLWNEGLRSPFSVNMVLDRLVEILQKQYDPNFSKPDLYKSAMDWGNYWSDHFINGTNVVQK
ncbi:hypothetical protein MCAV_06480 [[Mycoplasma] cavipharyngis]|uniref:hypothetical protein n=1 Tax=[Mycoplasma] cavipharyngis TaxID=92757 RepID=UPI0037039A3A